MPYLDDQPDSVARRLIQALAGEGRPPRAVLEEYRGLREWDPGQLDRLTQAFDAAQAVQRLPDSVHATVREALRRWSRAARHRSTDRMRALPDPGDWTEELPLPDAENGAIAGKAEAVTRSRLAARLGVVPDATSAHDRASPELQIGPGTVLLGRYEVFTLLGSGGTAMIHGARDRRRDVADGDLQHVAVKTPRTDVADPERAVARLKREFRQTRLLPHPNIVRMFDLDCDRGLWFITMEWLDGESLSRRLRRAAPDPLPVHEVWPIVSSCGQALAFAHGRGIVHGDFKPSNVMIGADGDAHLLDFGAAPDVSSSGESDPDDDGRVLATRCYASPEALAGQPPDPRDDVFSFACVVYEMLAGRHPFDRRAATTAHDAGATPAPIPALDAARFEALAQGLAWRREDRPDGMPQLLDGLLGDHRVQAALMKPASPPSTGTTAATLATNAMDASSAPATAAGAAAPSAPAAEPAQVAETAPPQPSADASVASPTPGASAPLAAAAAAAAPEPPTGPDCAAVSAAPPAAGSAPAAVAAPAARPALPATAAAAGSVPSAVAPVARPAATAMAATRPGPAGTAMPAGAAQRQGSATGAPAQTTTRPLGSGRAVYIAFGALLLLTVSLVLRGWRDSDTPPSPESSARRDAVIPGAALRPGAATLPGGALTDAPGTGGLAMTGSRADPAPGVIDAPDPAAPGQSTIAAPRTAPAARRSTRQVSLDAASLEVSEGAYAAVITMHRTGDARGIVPVIWRVEGGSALHGRDFGGPLQGTARFTSGQRMRTVYIPLINDDEPEGPETFTVSVRPATRVVAAGKVTRSIVTIIDDD